MTLSLRSRSSRTAALLLTAAVRLGGGVSAADDLPAAAPADSSFGGEVEVTVVNIDVMVRDRDGQPVEGLTAADFRVLQDGVEMPISNFAAFSTSAGAAAAEATVPATVADIVEAAPPPQARPPISMVLYVDSANLHPLQRNRVLDRVKTFVRNHLSPPMRMMVVATRPALEIRQPFTDDPAAVIAALEQTSRESGARFLRDVERNRILERLAEIASDRRSSRMDFTDQPDIVIARAQLQGQITSWIQEETFAARDSLAQLREAVGLFAGLEGRRSVVHISSGLSMTPGAGLLNEFSAVFRDPSIFSRAPQVSLADEYRSLAVAASRATVSLYTLDATGLSSPEGFDASDAFAPGAMTSAIDLNDLQGSLRYLAESTGGLAIVNTNDPTAGLERIANDHASWYSVGYTIAQPGGSDVAHRLEVQLPRHPRMSLRFRRWFVDTSPETRLVDLVIGQLTRDEATNPMGLRLEVGDPAPTDDTRRILPLRLSVPLRHLPLVDEGGFLVGRLEVCIAVRDDRGRRSSPSLQTVEVRIPAAGYDPSRESLYGLDLRLAVRDREHTIAAGVLDRGSGLISSTRVSTAAQ